jgi:type II secretory pathway component PulC
MRLTAISAIRRFPLSKTFFVPAAVSTVLGIVFSMAILILVNASLMKIPIQGNARSAYEKSTLLGDVSDNIKADYKAITERNLFRAKLQVEIPQPRSEKDIEEENLTNAMKNLTLKGVWMGQKKNSNYAVIDKGQQKGVWTYETGETVDAGLVVSDIQRNSVTLTKDDFVATIKLFAKGFDRVRVPGKVLQVVKSQEVDKPKTEKKGAQVPTAAELGKEIRSEGRTIVVSKALLDKIRADNSIIMSSVAVKAAIDRNGKSEGFQVVSIDRGSLAEKIGIAPNDIVQEVNGYSVKTSEDIKKAQGTFNSSNKFEVKVLRGGQTRTLYYEVK